MATMVQLHALLCTVCALTTLTQAMITPCQRKTAAALANNERPPKCWKHGKISEKQFNEVFAWSGKGKFDQSAYIELENVAIVDHSEDTNPERCTAENLAIRFQTINELNPAPAYVPVCDEDGNYVPLQCRPLDAFKCTDDSITPGYEPNDPPAYSECDPSATENVGRAPTHRSMTDIAQYWTMVDYINKFTQDGKVYSFELYSNAEGRPLKIGIYRPVSSADCHLKLVQQIAFDSFQVGYNKVELAGSNVLNVQAGDMFGFTWLNYGVVAYDNSATGHYCEQQHRPSVSGAYLWMLNRYGNRDYSIRMNVGPDCEAASPDGSGDEDLAVTGSCGSESQSVGRTPIARSATDSAQYWTMVDIVNKFSEEGQVNSFELYSNAAGRPLRIGIYRPASDRACHVKLVQQIEYRSFPVGYNKVELTGSNVLNVQAGDMFGFTWLNYGVVAFNSSSAGHYCEQPQRPSVDETYLWALNRYGNRDYSIRMNFNAKCVTLPPVGTTDPPQSCKECWCVNPSTGKEVKNSRAMGDVEC